MYCHWSVHGQYRKASKTQGVIKLASSPYPVQMCLCVCRCLCVRVCVFVCMCVCVCVCERVSLYQVPSNLIYIKAPAGKAEARLGSQLTPFTPDKAEHTVMTSKLMGMKGVWSHRCLLFFPEE